MKLAFRPTKLKIKVGVIADAAWGPFLYIDPKSTLNRIYDGIIGNGIRTPYEHLWHFIGAFYTDNQWNELSNERLDQKCNQIVSQGSDKLVKGEEISFYFESYPEIYTGHILMLEQPKQQPIVSREQIKEASERWVKYGWLNYEEKRADKLKTAGRAAKWTALITGGGSIFGGL